MEKQENKRSKMNTHAKTIKLFLIDGDPNGRMTCELSNWTGKAYKIPRIQVKNCNDREDLSNTGVYMLFGKDSNNKDLVYIGEAESILKRLIQHLDKKDFWNEAIVIISKDENLNKAHIKYLESRLYEIATDSGRYNIANSVTPTQSSISESDQAEMEEFLDNIKLLVNTLGHKVLEKKRVDERSVTSQIFSIQAARGADAQGEPVSEGFLILKGSFAAHEEVSSMPKGFSTQRKQLLSQGILSQGEGFLLFKEDTIFSSPSTAASIVMGRNANGLIEWKTKDGIKLKDYEKTQTASLYEDIIQ